MSLSELFPDLDTSRITAAMALSAGGGEYDLPDPCAKCGGTKGVIYPNYKNPGWPQQKCLGCKRAEPKINAATTRANRAAYRAGLKTATPLWLTKKQKSLIKSFYQFCQDISQTTGIAHHVDHIVPLRNENVCGLHVPWNLQVIPASANMSKSNSLETIVKSSRKSPVWTPCDKKSSDALFDWVDI